MKFKQKVYCPDCGSEVAFELVLDGDIIVIPDTEIICPDCMLKYTAYNEITITI